MGDILIVKYTNFEILIEDIIKIVTDIAHNYFKQEQKYWLYDDAYMLMLFCIESNKNLEINILQFERRPYRNSISYQRH